MKRMTAVAIVLVTKMLFAAEQSSALNYERMIEKYDYSTVVALDDEKSTSVRRFAAIGCVVLNDGESIDAAYKRAEVEARQELDKWIGREVNVNHSVEIKTESAYATDGSFESKTTHESRYSEKGKKKYYKALKVVARGQNKQGKVTVILVNDDDPSVRGKEMPELMRPIVESVGDGSLKMVEGSGCGSTEEKAILAALRDALQYAVGVYADSKLSIQNDEIVDDEIITHSKGFFERYEVISREEGPDGKSVTVKIKAWVRARASGEGVGAQKATKSPEVDGALVLTDVVNKINAEKLVVKEFKRFCAVRNLFDVGVISNIKPIVLDRTDDELTLRFVYQIRFSDNYYKKIVPQLTGVLDQVADRDRKAHQKKGKLEVVSVNAYPQCCGGEEKKLTIPAFVYIANPKWIGGESRTIVSIVTKVNEDGTAQIREWKADPRIQQVIKDQMRKMLRKDEPIYCRLTLRDAKNDVVAEKVLRFSRADFFADVDAGRPIFMPLMPAPLFCTPKSCDVLARKLWGLYHGQVENFALWSDSYVGFADFTLKQEDVVSVKSLKGVFSEKIPNLRDGVSVEDASVAKRLTEYTICKCEKCGGKGHWQIKTECGYCGGTGQVYSPPKRMIKGWTSGHNVGCSYCAGKGYRLGTQKCDVCGGEGKLTINTRK